MIVVVVVLMVFVVVQLVVGFLSYRDQCRLNKVRSECYRRREKTMKLLAEKMLEMLGKQLRKGRW